MKAIILAAGRGSRMRELTNEVPKCLIKLRNKPLLDWQLDALQHAGISEIGIVTGYKRELLVGRNLTEFHNPRWSETQMVRSLMCADQWLSEEACIVSYSDIFYDKDAIQMLIDCNEQLAVAYDPYWLGLWRKRFDDPLTDAETFKISPEGRILEIGSAPNSLDEVQGQYMGLIRFTPASWGELRRIWLQLPAQKGDQMHMTAAIQAVITANRLSVKGVPYRGRWGEVDSPEDLASYADD